MNMKSRQVPFFLYWRVENVQFWINSIGHLGWLSRISNFSRFHKNANSLELWKYISENSSPKGSFWSSKRTDANFPFCRRILLIYRQWLLINVNRVSLHIWNFSHTHLSVFNLKWVAGQNSFRDFRQTFPWARK